MLRLSPVMLLMMWAGSASAVELSLISETSEVPLYGAACGVVTIANRSRSDVQIDVPSLAKGNLRFELQRGDSISDLVGGFDIAFLPGPKLTLAPSSSINIPFYLLKRRSYFFEEAGPCALRARFSPGDPQEVVTSRWVQLDVVNDSVSGRWKSLNDGVSDVIRPFELPFVPMMHEWFGGSSYYTTHMIYQSFNAVYLVEPAGRVEVLRRRMEIAAELKHSGIGREMWESFAEGKCTRAGDRISGARYMLVF